MNRIPYEALDSLRAWEEVRAATATATASATASKRVQMAEAYRWTRALLKDYCGRAARNANCLAQASEANAADGRETLLKPPQITGAAINRPGRISASSRTGVRSRLPWRTDRRGRRR